MIASPVVKTLLLLDSVINAELTDASAESAVSAGSDATPGRAAAAVELKLLDAWLETAISAEGLLTVPFSAATADRRFNGRAMMLIVNKRTVKSIKRSIFAEKARGG